MDLTGAANLAPTAFGLLALTWASHRRVVARPGTPPTCAPGWLARRRARGGIRHPRAGAALGYRSAFGRVALSGAEFALGGLVLGAPGSGKTTLARLLIEALAHHRTAGVILDPKPSAQLTAAVAGVGGTIWTLGGELVWDALPDDPTELANQLVEIEPVDGQMRVYRNAARLVALAAGNYLHDKQEHPTLERVALLMRPGALSHTRHAPKLSSTEWDGVKSFGTSLRILADGAAGPSLGVGATPGSDSLRLEDAMADGKIVLFQCDSGRYPEETRQIGAWVLRAMLRLLRTPYPCWLIADEFARLGWQGRHAVDLLALGREFKKPVVLLSQGPSDFRELGPHALDQVAQDAAWVLAFRQGTRDSDVASRLLGVRQSGEREQRIVPASVLEDLIPGTGVLRVPPIERHHARVEPVRIALPAGHAELSPAGDSNGTQSPTTSLDGDESPSPESSGSHWSPPDPRIERYSERIGEHWVWRQDGPVNQTTGYPRLKMRDRKYQYVHILWWEVVHGPRPRDEDGEVLTVDHTCEFGKRCVWPGCKRLLPRGANTEDRWQRERGDEDERSA